MPTNFKYSKPSERERMTRSELFLRIQNCERAMLARRQRNRDDWPEREEFWQIHAERCRFFSELNKRDAALVARFEAGLPADVGPKDAVEVGQEERPNGKLF